MGKDVAEYFYDMRDWKIVESKRDRSRERKRSCRQEELELIGKEE